MLSGVRLCILSPYPHSLFSSLRSCCSLSFPRPAIKKQRGRVIFSTADILKNGAALCSKKKKKMPTAPKD